MVGLRIGKGKGQTEHCSWGGDDVGRGGLKRGEREAQRVGGGGNGISGDDRVSRAGQLHDGGDVSGDMSECFDRLTGGSWGSKLLEEGHGDGGGSQVTDSKRLGCH